MLLSTYQLGDLTLKNRVIMAAMTRARATNEGWNPTEAHAEYYSQRASAGLILTESVWVSQQAVGFINIPGIYTTAQIEGWKSVTEAVRAKDGRIFVQLVHSGSVSHPDYFNGDLPYGPSEINPEEQVFVQQGFVPTVTPRAYSSNDIANILSEFRIAALNAKAAGFDGIELHSQLFTLIPQFLSEATNKRTDDYGGSIEKRSRLLFEILDELIEVFPNKKVGIKFTPAAFNNGIIKPDEHTVDTYKYLLNRLNSYDLAFLEIVGPRVNLNDTHIAEWGKDFFGWFRSHYSGTIIANLGFDGNTGNQILNDGKADLVSFGLPFIANPDYVARLQNNWPLSEAKQETFYMGGTQGFTDYSTYNNTQW